MTEKRYKQTSNSTDIGKTVISLILVGAVLAAALFLADELGGYVKEGIRLVIERVLPSTIPFMIISGFAAAHIHPESLPLLGGIFEGVFSVPRSGFGCFLIGNLTGFPIGARLTADLRLNEEITQSEAERLIAYSNNPSPAFITTVVGAGLFGDVNIGAILLFSVFSGTVISAQIMREDVCRNSFSAVNSRQSYDFIDSVKNCTISCLYMSGFIIIFSAIIGLIKISLPDSLFKVILITLTELAGAVSYIASSFSPLASSTVAICAFALGFGGLSVLFQISSIAKEAHISMRKYIPLKLIEGCSAAAIAFILSYLYLGK